MVSQSLNTVVTIIGTLKEVDEALDLVMRGLVKLIPTHGTLHDIDRIFDEMGAGQLAGVVIKVSL